MKPCIGGRREEGAEIKEKSRAIRDPFVSVLQPSPGVDRRNYGILQIEQLDNRILLKTVI